MGEAGEKPSAEEKEDWRVRAEQFLNKLWASDSAEKAKENQKKKSGPYWPHGGPAGGAIGPKRAPMAPYLCMYVCMQHRHIHRHIHRHARRMFYHAASRALPSSGPS
jgi:hypothetical protein